MKMMLNTARELVDRTRWRELQGVTVALFISRSFHSPLAIVFRLVISDNNRRDGLA